MLPYKRSQRVGHLIKKEVSDIILNRLTDTRLGFITVTGVKVTDDLKLARVHYSVLKDEDREVTGRILEASRSFIRSELGRRIKMRFTPDVEFIYDEGPSYGDHISRLLQEIQDKE
jgi:ribosome-binding factor A